MAAGLKPMTTFGLELVRGGGDGELLSNSPELRRTEGIAGSRPVRGNKGDEGPALRRGDGDGVRLGIIGMGEPREGELFMLP